MKVLTSLNDINFMNKSLYLYNSGCSLATV